jgi:glutathione S-transferase
MHNPLSGLIVGLEAARAVRKMKLYESVIPSGNAYKVRLLMAQLELNCEISELDILATPSQTRLPDFLHKNPNGRIPVLELDDGTCLPESNAILFYLADGTEYLPTDRLSRARVLEWMFFEQYSHEPYIAVLKFWTYWGGLSKLSGELQERCRERGQAALEVMARHLEGRSFFVTERYTIADISLFAYTQSAAAVGYAVPVAVDAWLERVRQQPHYVPIKPDPLGRAPSAL